MFKTVFCLEFLQENCIKNLQIKEFYGTCINFDEDFFSPNYEKMSHDMTKPTK